MTQATATTLPGGFGAWMRLLRISNAPTAATGTLVGAVAGSGLMPNTFTLALCATGSVLLYSGGMVMNDYFDQPIDRIERPARPIVSGQVPESAALLLGMLLFAAGVIALLVASGPALPWTLLLVSCILAYNLLHRSPVAGPALMACCRALVPVIGAIACAPEGRPNWMALGYFAIPLGLHTLAISIAARHEASVDAPARLPRMAVASALAGVAALAPLGALAMRAVPPMPSRCMPFYVVAILFAGWLLLRGLRAMAQPAGTARGVMSWIAAIATVDAASLAMLDAEPLAWIAAGATLLTLAMQRRVAGS